MNNYIDLSNIQKIDIIENDIFGNLEIIKADKNYYIIKKITNQLENLITKKKEEINLFFGNENFPEMQKCYGKKNLWSCNYLVFDYFDYTLENLEKNNRINNCFLKENSILNLFYTIQIFLSKLKKKNIIYPFLLKKCIFCTRGGDLKIANPLLFNEYYENRKLVKKQEIKKLDNLMKNLGIILLENCSLVKVFDEGGILDLDLIEKAFKNVKEKYSFLILHILKLFNFGIKNEIRKNFYEDNSFFKINQFLDFENKMGLEKKSIYRHNLEYDKKIDFSERSHTHKIFEYEKRRHNENNSVLNNENVVYAHEDDNYSKNGDSFNNENFYKKGNYSKNGNYNQNGDFLKNWDYNKNGNSFKNENYNKNGNSFKNESFIINARNEKKIYSDIPLDYKYKIENITNSKKISATPLKNIPKSEKKSIKATLLKDMEKMNESINSNETFTYNFNNFSKFSEKNKMLKSAPIFNSNENLNKKHFYENEKKFKNSFKKKIIVNSNEKNFTKKVIINESGDKNDFYGNNNYNKNILLSPSVNNYKQNENNKKSIYSEYILNDSIKQNNGFNNNSKFSNQPSFFKTPIKQENPQIYLNNKILTKNNSSNNLQNSNQFSGKKAYYIKNSNQNINEISKNENMIKYFQEKNNIINPQNSQNQFIPEKNQNMVNSQNMQNMINSHNQNMLKNQNMINMVNFQNSQHMKNSQNQNMLKNQNIKNMINSQNQNYIINPQNPYIPLKQRNQFQKNTTTFFDTGQNNKNFQKTPNLDSFDSKTDFFNQNGKKLTLRDMIADSIANSNKKNYKFGKNDKILESQSLVESIIE